MNLPFINRKNTGYFAKSDKISRKNRMIIISAIAIFLISVITLTLLSMPTKKQQEQKKLDNTLTQTAQKARNNDALIATNSKRSGDFAMAQVGDKVSSAKVFYKMNADGSASQIAIQQNFDPIILLQRGMSINNIAELTNSSAVEIQKSVNTQCGYNGGNTLGFFVGSFLGGILNNGRTSLNNNDVQMLRSRITPVIQAQNSGKKDPAICVVAVSTNSAQVVNPNVNVITSFQVQFITSSYDMTTHNIAITVDMNFHTTTMLDGQQI
jgi:hypothetical protein